MSELLPVHLPASEGLAASFCSSTSRLMLPIVRLWNLCHSGGGASGLSFVCLICVSLISGAETFSSFDWWFGFLSCELPLSPQPCFPGLFVWFLLICGSSNPGSVATTFCQLAACLFTLLMELFEAQGFYIII